MPIFLTVMYLAFRNLLNIFRRYKVAFLLNILGLSVAFATFVLILMQVQYESTYNACYPNRDRIFRLEVLYNGQAQATISRPMAEVLAQKEAATQYMTLMRVYASEVQVSSPDGMQDKTFKDDTYYMQPDGLKIFSFEMIQGDTTALDAPNQVVLPQSLATKYFGEATIVGKTLFLNNDTVVIGGVYKDFPKNALTQNGIWRAIPPTENVDNWGTLTYQAFFMLHSEEAAPHFLDRMMDYMDYEAAGFPSKEAMAVYQCRISPLKDIYMNNEVAYDVEHGSRTWMYLMTVLGVLLITIAAINYTNFSSSMVPFRIKNINTQKVLGSTDTRLRIALLGESVLMALCAFCLSLLIIYACRGTFVQNLISPSIALREHWDLIAISAGISVLTGFLAGLWPVFYMTSFAPAMVLKGSFGLSPKGKNARRLLLSIQFVAAIALITNVIFLVLQQRFISNAPLGYDKDQLYVTWVGDNITYSLDAFQSEVTAYPGIEQVALINSPLSASDEYSTMRSELPNGVTMALSIFPCSSNILPTLGIPIIDGRDFLPGEVADDKNLFIINSLAHEEYGVSVGDTIKQGLVIGMIPDIKFATLDRQVSPMAFMLLNEPWKQIMGYNHCCYLRLAPGADPQEAIAHVDKCIRMFSPNAIPEIASSKEVSADSYTKLTTQTRLFSLFGLLAVFISLVGVFGLVSFENAQKRKEIGVRKVFGSTSLQILEASFKQYLLLVAICTVVALPLSYYMVNSWMKDFAYRIPLSAWVFIVAFAAIACITLLTVSYQNWKAARENPIGCLNMD